MHTAHPAFQASETLGAHLQQLLVDLTDLHLQGKQAHWNVVGKNFCDLHLQLDEIVDNARNFSDDVAEDPTTADLLHAIIQRLEQLAWMVDAENRIANSSLPRSLSV